MVNMNLSRFYGDILVQSGSFGDDIITRAEFGSKWCLIETGDSAGIALAYPPADLGEEASFPYQDSLYQERARQFLGQPLSRLQARILSMCPVESSLALAAINCALNQPGRKLPIQKPEDLMPLFQEKASRQKLVAIGAFPFLKRLDDEVPTLERRPKAGNLPDWSAPLVIPAAELLIVTAATLINKTLPGILELKQSRTRAILMGPSAPLCEALFSCGIDRICTLMVPVNLPSEILSSSRELFEFEGVQKVDFKRGSIPDTSE